MLDVAAISNIEKSERTTDIDFSDIKKAIERQNNIFGDKLDEPSCSIFLLIIDKKNVKGRWPVHESIGP
ncbi:hypothetical protein ACMGD3_00120 [Lysinibacillus sphaericus]|uniref:hypothetical protein n=1 Tax=Lysinibacillus sphaericus TaxID=1421 RepID=UPI003F7AC805